MHHDIIINRLLPLSIIQLLLLSTVSLILIIREAFHVNGLDHKRYLLVKTRKVQFVCGFYYFF